MGKNMYSLTDLQIKIIGALVLLAGGVVLGLWAGYELYKPAPATPEHYAPAAIQKDGSLILEKKPDAQAKPAQEIPKGAVVERIVKVTVKPKTIVSTSSQWSPPDHIADANKMVDCPPVTVDLSLVKLADDTRRVIASSPDGDVVGGVDIPVEAAKPAPKQLSWAAGISYTSSKRGGAWVERDIGPFRLGGDVMQDAGGVVGMVRVGLRF